jgi:hypothetical protein
MRNGKETSFDPPKKRGLVETPTSSTKVLFHPSRDRQGAVLIYRFAQNDESKPLSDGRPQIIAFGLTSGAFNEREVDGKGMRQQREDELQLLAAGGERSFAR